VTGSGETIPLSLSVGTACYPSDGSSCHELIAVADAEMYAAKQEARPYQEGLGWEDVIEELRSGRELDPSLVEPFLRAVQEELASRRSA
jgi:GGDEF domain-containing protein